MRLKKADKIVKITSWINALESKKYTQAEGALCVQDHYTKKYSFCCLGVLCDLEGYKRKDGEFIFDDVDQGNLGELPVTLSNRFNTSGVWWITLTNPIKKKLGKSLTEEEFTNLSNIVNNQNKFNLISLNDTCKFSFAQIAKVLRIVYLK